MRNQERNTAAKRRARRHITTACKGLLLALALMLSGPALAAGFTCAKPAASDKKGELDELQEVVVTGKQAKTDTKDVQAWLKLLVGKFTYEGYVDLCGNGNAEELRQVTGKANCISSRDTPNVLCDINVRWPATRGENGAPVLGGVSNLAPAYVIYSIEVRHLTDIQVDRWAPMFTQVDNKGVAEWASGTLSGDTFISREPCVGIPGVCQKTTRITARPNSNEISMLVDISIDNQRVQRQTFLLHRESKKPDGRAIGKSSASDQ